MKLFTKFILNYLIYPLILGFIFFIPQKTLAQETYQEGTIIFQDDFNDGNYNGWIVESGSWGIDSLNRLYGNQFGTLKTGRLSVGNTWDNYRIEVDTQNNGGFDQGIMFRKADSNNYYEVDLRFDDGARSYNTPEVKLTKIQAGNSTTLFSTRSFQLNRFTNYRIKIEVVQTHIQLWIDSTLIFTIDDPTTTLTTGPIALSYWTGDYGSVNVRFDNVKVTSLSVINPILPVIFIPGIGGSELKVNSNTNWNYDNGHGETYSRSYNQNENVWVNTREAIALGNDDYFDVLKLQNDAVTSIADITPTGNLVSQGYGDIDPFFTGMGYIKGTNYFVFTYDWRKDIVTNKSALDTLVDYAKTKSGKSKVNIVAHSMGGLIAQSYISDSSKATKVNKLIKLGVPSLGSAKMIKTLLYGDQIGSSYLLGLISLNPQEVKDIASNLASIFALGPSSTYYSFYDNSNLSKPFVFNDLRDIDKNGIIGPLNYNELKTLYSNLQLNMTAFNLGENYHNTYDSQLNQANGVQLYNIVGTSQPTLGQIIETTYSIWPLSILSKTEEIFINGDDTVPLYSASLTNGSLDLSAGATTYYVGQKHNDLVKGSGIGMQTVKAILQNDTLPAEVQGQKISLEGQQISTSLDIDIYDNNNNHTGLNSNGEVENNVSNTYYDSINNTKNVFLKNNTGTVKVKLTSSKKQSVDIKIAKYSNDFITQTAYYRNIPVTDKTTIEFDYNPNSSTPPTLPVDGQIIQPTTTITGSNVLDFLPPTTTIAFTGNKDGLGNYTGPVTITLTGSDIGSGILKTEYSTDNGVSVNTYNQPFIITGPGDFTLQVKSIDKLGNEESVQVIKFKILGSIISGVDSPIAASTASATQAIINTSKNSLSINNSLLERLAINDSDQKVLGVATKSINPIKKEPQKINLWNYLVLPILLSAIFIAGLIFSLLKPPDK